MFLPTFTLCRFIALHLLLLPVSGWPAFAQAFSGVPPKTARIERDLAYVEGGHERQKLDLYLPADAKGLLPLIIWVHGGGWQSGGKENCLPLRQGYLERGYALASIGYRLSGDAVFPAQIEDCKAAIRWLRAHAKSYALDTQRFAVWGSSAGGHLAALIGTSGGVAGFDVGTHLDQSSRVQAVCDFYGPTDFQVFVTTPGYESHAGADSPESKLLGGRVAEQRETARLANPVTHVSADDPPFLIVHGSADRTVPLNQSSLLFDALKKAGVSAHFHTINGAGHGSGFGGEPVDGMVRAFFDTHLKGRQPAPVIAKETESNAMTPPSASAAARAGGPGFDGILARFDTDKDGRLSREEFRGPPPLFHRLDRDGDGFVSRQEHEALFPPGHRD